MVGTVLLLGASGHFGAAAARAFAAAGWEVRRFRRGSGPLAGAARGADVIVNGWNPGYPAWAAELPGQTADLLDAARATGATILQPLNVYVYGAGAPPVLGPDTPHAASNPLGRVRVAMEAAMRDSGVPVIGLRAGDFIDDHASGNWIDRIIARPLARGRIDWPGDPQAAHAWAYLPDLARAAVALAARRADLPTWAEIPFPGYTLSGNDLAAAFARVTGRPVLVRRMSWLPIRLARPFWPLASGLIEMRYLWSMPHRIDPARFEGLLPHFRATPVEEALAACLRPAAAG